MSRLSVRQRLTAAVAALVALSLVVVGVTLYGIESRRIERQVEASLTQEINEFRTLQTEIDPRTNKPFTSADRLLTVFLQRNLPDENEALFAFGPTGGPTYQGQGDPALQRASVFRQAVDELRADGGTRDVKANGDTYRIAVQPVTDQAGDSAFVVAHNVDASRGPLLRLMATYALLGALSLILIAGFASWLTGRLLRPLRRLSETAHGISEGDLTRRIEVTGRDDLTDLQRTFNDMLDRLEEAFVAQRHLLDDAGHELRTPLTVLRGHLEVLDVDDPADVAATRSLLLDEIDRMSRLIDDLLMLAKAERPDFVTPVPTDVEALTLGILDRATALGARRWMLDEAAAGEVPVDGQRITQAMLQLAENAVRHSPEGSEIGIGSARGPVRIDWWVRDLGTGIEPAQRAVVFDRFTQGENAHEGFGLGLSIVRAIAVAHGGDVILDDTPSGTTVRLTIPLEDS